MKSVTLTKSMREDILSSVIRQWEKMNKAPDFKQAQHDFAMLLWEEKYGKYQKHFNAVPENCIKRSEYVRYCVGGQVKGASFKDGKKMPVAMDGYSDPIIKSFDDSDTDYQDFMKVSNAYDEWEKRRSEVIRETQAVLESVNTTRQLLELWPQCEPFLPAHIADPDKAIRLPAMQMSRLNERLGIK